MHLEHSKILITGGSSGIGKATAKALIHADAKVAITGRNLDKLIQTAEEIGALPIHADVSNPEDVESAFNLFQKEYGNLDCLINNAGIGAGFNTIDNLSMEDMRRVYEINVFGVANMSQKAAQIFKEQNYGNLINIASTAATKGYANGTIYASSKFALRGMTLCWQAELRKHNVRVMLVNPSEVPTAFGSPERIEKQEVPNKLTSFEIAHTIVAMLEMDDRGFIPEVAVFATNP